MRFAGPHVLSFAFMICCGAAHGGVTYQWWTGAAADNLWSNPDNWSNTAVPTSTSNITFDGDGLTGCIVDGDSQVGRLWINGGITADGAYPYTITIPAGSSLATALEFDVAGRIVVEGEMRVNTGATRSLLRADVEQAGDLTINAGGALVLGDGVPFEARAGAPYTTTFTIAGAPGNSGVVRCDSPTGTLGEFTLAGNVSLTQAAFRRLGDSGLRLSSGSGHAVSASDVRFLDSGASAWGSQHLLVEGEAWADYVFERFSFVSGAGSTDPEYAVENALSSASAIIFDSCDVVGSDKMYGDPATDPASTGAVVWVLPESVYALPYVGVGCAASGDAPGGAPAAGLLVPVFVLLAAAAGLRRRPSSQEVTCPSRRYH